MDSKAGIKLMEQLDKAAVLCAEESHFVAQFAQALEKLSPAQQIRINPVCFADDAGLDREKTLSMFVCGTKVGLFSFEWGLVCPNCGTIAANSQTISGVADAFHCAFCNRDAQTTLDDTVEVTFASDMNREAGFDHQETFQANFRYHLSPGYLRYGEWLDFHHRNTLAAANLGVGEQATLEFNPQPGDIIRLYCIDMHSSISFKATEQVSGDAVQELSFSLTAQGFNGESKMFAPAPTRLHIANFSDMRVWVQAIRMVIPEIQSIMSLLPPAFGPYLSGQRLLTNQVFREQFGMERLIPDLRLRVKTVCLLFTDLKGSTDLYDRTGDLEAYNLVQKHFEILRTAVRQHSGAIIKTMGDAIMAAFPDPESGLRAAIDMLQGMEQFSRQINPETLGLKVGIHAGAVLTVNSGGSLDFFGQTVNIAARVQGLAESGEICITDAVRSAAGCEEVLRQHGFSLNAEVSRLKGVEQERRIFRCYRA